MQRKRKMQSLKKLTDVLENTKRGKAAVKAVLKKDIKRKSKEIAFAGACARLHNDVSRRKNNCLNQTALTRLDKKTKKSEKIDLLGVPMPDALQSFYKQEKALEKSAMRKMFRDVKEFHEVKEVVSLCGSDAPPGCIRRLAPVVAARIHLLLKHPEIAEGLRPVIEVIDSFDHYIFRWYGDGIAGGDLCISLWLKTQNLTHSPYLVDHVAAGRFSEKSLVCEGLLQHFDKQLEELEKNGVVINGKIYRVKFEPTGDIPWLLSYMGQLSATATYGNPWIKLRNASQKNSNNIGIFNSVSAGGEDCFVLPFWKEHKVKKLAWEAENHGNVFDANAYWEKAIGAAPFGVALTSDDQRKKDAASVKENLDLKVCFVVCNLVGP